MTCVPAISSRVRIDRPAEANAFILCVGYRYYKYQQPTNGVSLPRVHTKMGTKPVLYTRSPSELYLRMKLRRVRNMDLADSYAKILAFWCCTHCRLVMSGLNDAKP